MKPEEMKAVLVSRNIEKSDESVKAAELLIEGKLLSRALNSVYYACFYIVSALALKYGFSTSKHQGLLNWFNKKFVNDDKIFDKEMFHVYRVTFKYRQQADYDIEYKPTLEDTIEQFEKAKIFIETVKRYLEKI